MKNIIRIIPAHRVNKKNSISQSVRSLFNRLSIDSHNSKHNSTILKTLLSLYKAKTQSYTHIYGVCGCTTMLNSIKALFRLNFAFNNRKRSQLDEQGLKFVSFSHAIVSNFRFKEYPGIEAEYIRISRITNNTFNVTRVTFCTCDVSLYKIFVTTDTSVRVQLISNGMKK